MSAGVESRSAQFYQISEDQTSITCLTCGCTSEEPEHVRLKFCPACQMYHEDHGLMLRLAEGYRHTFHSTEKDLRMAA